MRQEAVQQEMTTGRPAFEIPPQVLFREVDGQMVLLDLDTEQYFGLNEVGSHIVKRLTEEPWDEAFTALIEDYDVDSDVLRRDIDDLIAALLDAGLLQPAEDGD